MDKKNPMPVPQGNSYTVQPVQQSTAKCAATFNTKGRDQKSGGVKAKDSI